MGVIRRERRKVPSMQGPGMAVYFLNPHLAWNGSLEVRKDEARKVEQPSLRLVTEPPAKDDAGCQAWRLITGIGEESA